MRPHVVWLIVLIAAVSLGGCSRQQSVSTLGGSVKVTKVGSGAQSVEVQTETGSAKVSTEQRTISEDELGVPVYPGSTVEVSSEYQGAGEGEQEHSTHHILSTKDSFDKVYAFYKSNLKDVTQQMKQNMGDNQVAIFNTKRKDGAPVSVSITTDNEQKVVRIQVMQIGAAP